LLEIVSQKEFADRVGVKPPAISKAIRTERIKPSAMKGKKLIYEKALEQFKKNCDVAKKRKPKQKKESEKPVIKKVVSKNTNLVTEEEIFGDAFDSFESKEPKKKAPYISDNDDPENELTKQRTRKEKAMADMAELKVLEYEGSLVDVEKATLAVFNVMREQRDHWLRFADRVSANMAARFEIDKVEYKTALLEEVKKHCKDIGELNFDLTQDN